MTDAAIWVRVSTGKQDEANQVPGIEHFAGHHGYVIRRRYELNDLSASKGEHRARLEEAMNDAWQGGFSVIIVWALDRISREGAEDALRTIRKFRERGCTLLSVQESWLNTTSEVQDVLVSFAGWAAQQEARRHSQRVVAGIEARRAKGLPVGGRKPGAKDRRPRRRRQPASSGGG